ATKGAPQPIAATSDHQPPPKAHRHRLYHGMLGFPLTPLTPFSPPTASDKRNSKTIITPPRPAKQNTPPYVIRKNAIRHLLTHRQLVLSLLFVPAETGPQLNHDADPIATIIGSHGDAQWVAPDQLPHLPLSSLMKKVVKEIMANGIAKADQQAQNASNHSNHIGRKNQQGNGPPTQRFMVSPR
ncbi:MAG: hypothetical protein ORN57_02780, partial [Alphaproteobacteria bacterium]|nr:hypothetical protein [Alphaproteobacteria bacterium]